MLNREEVINRLAQEDAETFTQLQSQYAHELIHDIGVNNELCEEKLEKLYNELQAKGYDMKNYEFDSDNIKYLKQAMNETDDEEDKKLLGKVLEYGETYLSAYTYAAEKCGFAKGSVENYCIALQVKSSKEALKEMDTHSLDSIPSEMGWTCQYAKNNFAKKGISSEQKIESLYTVNDKGECIVKKDKDGNPLIKDGDFALLLQGDHAWHCVRLNVDENGVVTYSAGNTERDHEPLSSLRKSTAAIIPTQDFAVNLAKEYYAGLSNEELQKLAAERGNVSDHSHTRDVMMQDSRLAAENMQGFEGLRDVSVCRADNTAVKRPEPREVAPSSQNYTAMANYAYRGR